MVAVSTVSYGSYVIQKMTKGQGGVMLAGVLGGAYSSTVTTVVLAKRAARENRPHLFSGVTLVASGMMYLRLAGLVTLFNRNLIMLLGAPFLVLAGGPSAWDGSGAGCPIRRPAKWSANTSPRTRWSCAPPCFRRRSSWRCWWPPTW